MTDRPLVLAGRQLEADARIDRASGTARGQPAEPGGGDAGHRKSARHMLARRFDEAERDGPAGDRAGRGVGDHRILAEVSIQSGIALAMSGDDRGLERIRDGIAIAIGAGADYLVELGLLADRVRLRRAAPVRRGRAGPARGRRLRRGTRVRFDLLRACLARSMRARARELGDRRCDRRRPPSQPALRGHQPLRRAPDPRVAARAPWRPDVRKLLDEALEMARRCSICNGCGRWPPAAPRWRGSPASSTDESELVDEAAALAHELAYPPAIEELAHWQHLADGSRARQRRRARTAFGLSAAGRPDLAADRWREVGLPLRGGSGAAPRRRRGEPPRCVPAVRRALGDADEGAHRGRDARRRHARAAWADPPPARNPAALTDRELDVLTLVAGGRTNREIAEPSSTSASRPPATTCRACSPSSVRSRGEAAVAALRLGIVAENWGVCPMSRAARRRRTLAVTAERRGTTRRTTCRST